MKPGSLFNKHLLAALLTLGAAGLLSSCQAGGAKPETAPVEEGIKVRVETPSFRTMEEVIEVSGNLEPIAQVDVPAEASGEVAEVLVKEGDQVRAGQALARIENDEYRLSQEQAQTALKVATSDYENAKGLFAEGMKSRSELEKLERSYADAKSNLALSRLRLAKTTVSSPIGGEVVSKNIEPHKQAGAGEILFTVADLSSFKVLVTVTEAEVGKLQPGQVARLRVDAVAKEADSFPITGQVSRIKPRVESSTGTVEVEVRFQNPGEGVKPGMFARLKIVTASHENALVIPRKALLSDDEKRVWVADQDQARLAELTLGLRDQVGVEVISGLQPTDQVIVEGQSALTPKSKIAIVNPLPEAAPGPAPLAGATK